MECSALMDNFVSVDETNILSAVRTGTGKGKVDVVVPEFTCITKKGFLANVIHKELFKEKEKCNNHFELNVIVYIDNKYCCI